MKYSATLIHAMSDYAMSALLLASPWIFGFSQDWNATTCTMSFGAAMTAYSLFTDYELSIRRVIPMMTHLALDAAAGAFLIAAPFIKGYSQTVWVPQVVIGIVEVSMAVLFAIYLGFTMNGNRRIAH